MIGQLFFKHVQSCIVRYLVNLGQEENVSIEVTKVKFIVARIIVNVSDQHCYIHEAGTNKMHTSSSRLVHRRVQKSDMNITFFKYIYNVKVDINLSPLSVRLYSEGLYIIYKMVKINIFMVMSDSLEDLPLCF